MEAFGIIKLIFGTTFLGLMMLTGIYNDESFYKVILAVIMTLGLLYGIGQLPYAFLIFIILGITIYTYVQTSSIEDTLFNTLLVFTVCILLGLFGDTDFFKPFRNFKLKEGFYFSPNARRLVSHSMTALQCQNVCANDKHCKFSYYGRNMERGGRGQCWNTHGSDSNQRPYGGKNRGGITWRNKKYTPKPQMSPFHLRWYSRWPHCNNITCMDGTLLDLKKKCSENANCDGFSWSKGRNNNNNRGSGCLKKYCKSSQEGRRGFGYGSHGFWSKGNGKKKCDERLRGWRQNGYRGCANITKSGKKCQKWTSQSPHRHTRTPGRYRGKGLGNHNYCRNPDGESGGIWCYTTDRRKRWEHCRPL